MQTIGVKYQRNRFVSLISMLLIFCWTCLPTVAADFAGLEKIEVTPSEMTLSGPRSAIQMIVTGYFANGEVRDLTHEARYRNVGTNPIVKVESGYVTSLGDGTSTIEVACGNSMKIMPLNVECFSNPSPSRSGEKPWRS
jgi:hypothetical protein